MAEWTLTHRLRYKKTLEAPNRLVVWDMKDGSEYETDRFEMEDCKIVVAYGNQIKQ